MQFDGCCAAVAQPEDASATKKKRRKPYREREIEKRERYIVALLRLFSLQTHSPIHPFSFYSSFFFFFLYAYLFRETSATAQHSPKG
jgi:hypothetical protein